MVRCYFCEKSFKSKKALYAHLQFCAERKKKKDQWLRYPIRGARFSGCIGVISRSPKTLEHIDKTHAKLESGTITPEGFAGYVQALSDVGLVEFVVESDAPTDEPRAAEEVPA
ncbi:MAG: hypothetical protein LLF90_03810 [Methanomicrobiaceae archaeon]|nr:hypothetical protein [Methanomicrobiaceae archaeon]